MSNCSNPASDCSNASLDCSVVAGNCPNPAENLSNPAIREPGPFKWSSAARKAAVLVAEDQITNAAIAQNCLISPRTLSAWKLHPDFRAEVERHKLLTAEDINAFSIARKIERVRALDRIHAKLDGLVSTTNDPNPAYLREIREYQKQAAIEVGQWQEQANGLKPGEHRLSVTYEAVQAIQQADPERWRRIEARAQAIMEEERAQDGAALTHQAALGASAGGG